MRSAKSLKAKGRYLQNVVKDKIVELFPYLKKKDIRCARDSEPGSDIKLLSLTARNVRIEKNIGLSTNILNNVRTTAS